MPSFRFSVVFALAVIVLLLAVAAYLVNVPVLVVAAGVLASFWLMVKLGRNTVEKERDWEEK
jgi:hypothetical protein